MRRLMVLAVAACTVLLLLLPSSRLQASHAQGIDVSYECLGGNTYRFRLTFYRDCSGIGASASQLINIRSASCGQNVNVTLNQVSGPVEVSPLCAAQLSQSTCNAGCVAPCLPGVEQYVYEGTFTFTQNCPDWVVSFEECCRNNSITNLQNPASQSLFVTSTLDNTNGLCNSSPTFTSTPVPFICAEQQYCYNHGAVDPDGDSLVYTLINPLDGPFPGNPIPYVNVTLNPTYPLVDTTGTIFFDSLTGAMCIIPELQVPDQVVVVAIQVEEYRNGVLIGTTTRDIQIVVLPCANQQPVLNPNTITNVTGAVQLDSNSVEVCPGVPITFTVTASDANVSDNVTMLSNVAAAIPGASFVTAGNNPVTGTFSWTPGLGDVGFHNFTVTIQDDGCPILGSQIFNFDITVVPSTNAGPDLNYCAAGSPVQLNAVGGTAFTWNTLSGGPANLSCNPCANPTAAPGSTVVLEVVSNLSAICKNRDTVTVFLVPDFVLDAGLDTTICRYGLAQLNVSATPGGGGFAPYTFQWSPTDSLSDPTIGNPTANPLDSTQYTVTVTSASGCTLVDSVAVNIDGVAPQVIVAPVDTICEGEPITFNTILAQDCGITGNACTGPLQLDTVGSNFAAIDDYGPWVLDASFNYSNKKQYLFTAAELAAAGIVGGNKISEIAFFVTVVGDPVVGAEIRMGCTADTVFPNTNFYTGLSLVKSAFTWVPNAGWTVATLDNDFMYDGSSSLIVEVCVDAQQALGTASNVAYELLTPNRTNFFNSPFAGGACAQVGGSITNARPMFRFGHCEALPPGITYTWTPPTFLNDPTIAEPTASPTTTTTYSLSVNDGVCVGTDNVLVVASPSFSVSLGNDTTLCSNQIYQVNAVIDPGSYTYQWTPTAGVSDPTIPNPVITAPAVSTTYYLTVTSSAACAITDSIRINVSGVAPIVNALADTSICPIGPGAQLSSQILQSCGPTAVACSGPPSLAYLGDPSGFSTSLYGPHYMFQGIGYSNRRQYIFTAAELQAAGFVGGGRIDAISLDYTSANQINTDITIRMGCIPVTMNEFDASLNFETGLTTVMGSTPVTPVVGLTTYNFTTPFMWDGQSNLIVEFCTDVQQSGLTATSASDVRYSQTGADNRTLVQNLFNADGACSTPLGLLRTIFRPNMQFHFCEALPGGLVYTWSPALTLNNPASPSPTATPLQTTTYTLTVSDGGACDGGDFVTVAIDSSNFVAAVQTPIVNCPSLTPTYQLDALVSGSPFTPNLPSCGVNGTPCTQPQYGVQVGNGTDISQTVITPFFQTTTDYRIQFLFRASELQAAGLSSGTISALAFDVADTFSTAAYDQLVISIGCTNATELTTAAWEATTVVAGPQAYDPVPGLSTFALTSPFDWDGTSNLVVQICNTNGTASAADRVRSTTSVGYNASMIQFNGTPGCNLPPAGAFLSQARPNIQFTVCPPPPNPFLYNWTPAGGLSDPTIANPVFTDATPSVADTFLVLVSGGVCDVYDTVIVPPCALPVEFMELFGEQHGSEVQLNWLTLMEQALDEFVVERKNGAGLFEEIGRVSAHGYTTGETRYAFVDPQPGAGSNLYRLRAVDMNGAFDFSNMVEISFNEGSAWLALYPNPTRSGQGFWIEYYAAAKGDLEIRVTDLWGRQVAGSGAVLTPGNNRIKVETSDLAQGTYLVELRGKGGREVRKLVLSE